VPAVNRDAWSPLEPLAAKLNQYVRAIHQGQASDVVGRRLGSESPQPAATAAAAASSAVLANSQLLPVPASV
jgi:hypothetical protein